MPEPPPEKQRDERELGTKPTGQGEAGNETQTPPAAATASTQTTDRAANAPRPRKPTSETRNTRAEGTRERTAASTPRAQPTNTDELGATAPTAARTADTDSDEGEREPEKPTTDAELTKNIELINSTTYIIARRHTIEKPKAIPRGKHSRRCERGGAPLAGARQASNL